LNRDFEVDCRSGKPDSDCCSATIESLFNHRVGAGEQVFTAVSEPVATGLIARLARPGGNITGFAGLEPSIAGKWLDLLKEIA
jgi:ABC-type uncharacterized transport system substrate-binding protein